MNFMKINMVDKDYIKDMVFKNSVIEKYVATITEGDEYHQTGEEHEISSYQLNTVKEEGLRLKLDDKRFRTDYTFYHIYPVKIEKRVYQMTCTASEIIEGGDRSNCKSWAGTIGQDSYKHEDPNEWMEHWP